MLTPRRACAAHATCRPGTGIEVSSIYRDRTGSEPARCRIKSYQIKRRRYAAPVRRSPRRALALGRLRPARSRRTSPQGITDLTGSFGLAVRVRQAAVFLASNCSARGRRVQGGPGGRRMRSAAPTLDPTPAPTDLGACEDDAPDQQPRGRLGAGHA